MSAFMCSSRHISVIVDASQDDRDATRRLLEAHKVTVPANRTPAEVLFTLLARENRRSVNYRYGEQRTNRGMGYCITGVRPAAEVIKLIHCLEYQSCEHPAWKRSKARAILADILNVVSGRVVGYDEAPWSI